MNKKMLLFISCALILLGYFLLPRPSVNAPISIMSFNIENGGTQIDFNKVVEAVQKANADVVGIQEAWGNTSLLAKKLGWKYYNNRQHIASRFPLYEPHDSKGLYLLIEVVPGKVVAMANIHLPDESYGPDLIKAGKSAASVEATESKVRLPTALPFIKKLSELAEEGIPVFLTGDFNSPSHLDWTSGTKAALPHHLQHVVWPVTKMIEQHGLVDAYRHIYPDPIKHPATTWPSGRPIATQSYDGFNPSDQDLPDRLDFIYSGGNANVISTQIVAEPKYKNATIHVWPWPSDHRAIVAKFKVVPVSLSLFKYEPLANKTTHNKPAITVSKQMVKTGEPFTISWHNAPGNRFDYLMLIPTGSKKTAWGEAIRLYTFSETNGSITYQKKNAKGNWHAWYLSHEGKWPMTPGKYEIRLMLDDGFTELARAYLKVTR